MAREAVKSNHPDHPNHPGCTYADVYECVYDGTCDSAVFQYVEFFADEACANNAYNDIKNDPQANVLVIEQTADGWCVSYQLKKEFKTPHTFNNYFLSARHDNGQQVVDGKILYHFDTYYYGSEMEYKAALRSIKRHYGVKADIDIIEHSYLSPYQWEVKVINWCCYHEVW